MDTNSGKKTFKQTLGLFDSTMIVVGSMIGSGIFIVSADISRTVGSPFYLLLTWVITGIITIIAALSYGELAAMMPKAGGQYVYLKEAYNSMIGFLYGWTFFLVIQTGTKEPSNKKWDSYFPSSSSIAFAKSFHAAASSLQSFWASDSSPVFA